VGESTTHPFYNFIKEHFSIEEFVRQSDAAVKYGVVYKNWSKREFIHHFESIKKHFSSPYDEKKYLETLLNKGTDTHLHDIIARKLWSFIQENQVSLDPDEYLYTWHFDAGKFKVFLKSELSKYQKIEFVYDTIVECKFQGKEHIEYIVGEDNKKYYADYFINCCGEHSVNERVFKEKYIPFSNCLLTNKAVVYPLSYTDKKNQFHPYTIAKTMKYGWRWITPTQSRIGTGYVFSDNHISVDQAMSELIDDVGDKTIQPFLVDFTPRCIEKPFKKNNCTVGMSAGFLEPLDAPGLAFTYGHIKVVVDLLRTISRKKESRYQATYYLTKSLNSYNLQFHLHYRWWCNFILMQYKTCHRNDTNFWIDQKNVRFDFHNQILSTLKNPPEELFMMFEYPMLYKTIAGKDFSIETENKNKPYLLDEPDTKTVHHIDYINQFMMEGAVQ
jgi:tryptophan halogenase